ncbi:MAG: hypothetical protein WC372_00260 [Candidatus Neomarinimicrobiota bacterium]|nr:hypothetical protein [Candidatus Neomarinimicrobiota bacterium]MDD3965596.1 hypothetical protein [Candidatus Neomarinimicrobiota bacterium]MDX9779422.1 hypothetical protein [bacterium]
MMNQKTTRILLAALNILLFLGMITVNGLANALPINGMTTGALSDLYPNLFVPAGLTFSIWGLIYLLLLVFLAFQLSAAIRQDNDLLLPAKAQIVLGINFILNMGWIFLWHYKKIFGSLLLMLGLLLTLIYLFRQIRIPLQKKWHLLVLRTPIGVYYGWISVATIANLTALLVSLNWGAWGLPANAWTIIVMVVAAILALLILWKHACLPYALVVIWAFVGIIIKRGAQSIVHQDIIAAAWILIGLITLLSAYTAVRQIKKAGK